MISFEVQKEFLIFLKSNLSGFYGLFFIWAFGIISEKPLCEPRSFRFTHTFCLCDFSSYM